MFKKRKNAQNKVEKIRSKPFSRKKRESNRLFKNQIVEKLEFEKSTFAVWRTKEKHDENVFPNPQEYKSNPSQPIVRRSSRLIANNNNNNGTSVLPPSNSQIIRPKSIFKEITEKYNELLNDKPARKTNKIVDSDKNKPVNKNIDRPKIISSPPTEINNNFDKELFYEARLLTLKSQNDKLLANIDDKVQHVNNMLKGKTSPMANRQNMKRKQLDNFQRVTKNDYLEPLKLFTPNKYIYRTPENQKFRPNIPVENTPSLVPGVLKTSKKLKVLYDIDENAQRDVDLNGFKAGAKVPIDHRYLKPICTNIFNGNDNQLLGNRYERYINLDNDINRFESIRGRQNTNEDLTVRNNLENNVQGNRDDSLDLHRRRLYYNSRQQEHKSTNVGKSVNYYNENDSRLICYNKEYNAMNVSEFTMPTSPVTEDADVNFTFMEVPNTGKFVPTALSIEQEMALKCSVRPAKVPRMNFCASLSRKSLNFDDIDSPENSNQNKRSKTFNMKEFSRSLQQRQTHINCGLFEDVAENDDHFQMSDRDDWEEY